MHIFVWGTGCAVSRLSESELDFAAVDGFIETSPRAAVFMGKPVLPPEAEGVGKADLIIVASRQAREISELCRKLSIDTAKLFFISGSHAISDLNADCGCAEAVLGKKFVSSVRDGARIIKSAPGTSIFPERDLSGDYVRLRTLELVSGEITAGGTQGDTAELGVYRGGFAACMNALLPERTLYLFDTFSGFGADEARWETWGGCSEAFIAAHESTDEKSVLARLPHPEKARIMKGLFPQSLGGLEARFCLVSLDVDFCGSTLAGLEYFYPRLNPGGYIFLHDYNSPDLRGVSAALAQYELGLGNRICRVPLCDIGGTAVITK